MKVILGQNVTDDIYHHLNQITPTQLRKLGLNKSKDTHSIFDRVHTLTSFLEPNANLGQRLWHIHNNTKQSPVCENHACNKHTTWSRKQKRYTRFCSKQCRAKNPQVNLARKSTCVERYGYDRLFSTEQHAQQASRTNINKYGVKHPFQSPLIQSQAIENVDHTKRIDLSKQSLKKKYGTANFGEVGSIVKQQLPKEHLKYNWWNKKRSQIENFCYIDYDQHHFLTYCNRFTQMPYFCKTCNTRFVDNIRDGKLPRCPTCYPMKRVKWKQQQIVDFCSSILDPSDIILSDRQIIKPQELDVLIPSKQIAIEFNGLYWHSEHGSAYRIDKNYHKHKTERCLKKGIQLIHVFEDEWVNKQQIIKSMIAYRLGLSINTIYARNTHVKEITQKVAAEFLSQHHIQGTCTSSIRLGLFNDNDQLLAVMTFGRARYNQQFSWELLRYCVAQQCNVVGGASKLFSYFKRTYVPDNIITYADRRFSKGELFATLGFTFKYNTSPNYFYVNINQGCKERFSRLNFQKHKLQEKLDFFDRNMTEKENMTRNGYTRIWDCGHSVYVWS